jgi:hypothetical protein
MDPIPELSAVRPAHRFDESALAAWLADHVEGGDAPVAVRQFAGGQSNPSFLLACGERRFVLRKAPPGKLLPSAHRVDREHRVMTALRATGVPVPRTLGLCEDASVIGTRVESLLFEEIARLRDGLVSAAELEKAKRSLEVRLLAGLGTSHALAFHVASDFVLLGRVRPLAERLEAIRAVGADDVQRVARTWLRDDGRSIVQVVPPAEPAAESAR